MNGKIQSKLQKEIYLQTIVSLFEEQVEKNRDKEAVVFFHEALTYGELNHKANLLAAVLRKNGVSNDQPVVIIAERSIELIVGIYAVLKAGGAYVPVNPSDPEKRIQFILKDCHPKAILIKNNLLKLNTDIPIFPISMAEAYEELAENPEKINTSQDLAYIMYTSGTSGEPKGCFIEHKSVIRLVKNANYITLNANTAMLQTGAPTFDAATFEIFGCLLNGGTLYLIEEEALTDSDMLLKAIEEYQINTMWLTSALFNHIVNQNVNVFQPLFYLLTGGEVISESHVRKFKEANKKTKLIHCYGPTENTTFTTTFEITDNFENIPIGKAISGTQVYIMNHSNLCQVGEEGELCVTGDGVSRGYLNQPQMTKEKFTVNPMGEGKMYHTGDLGKLLPDGNIVFLGRVDEQVKIRGYRVEPDEIKNVLCRIDGISDAVVLAKRLENKELAICAYYVKEKDIDTIEIRNYLSLELPDFMMPAFLIEIDKIPLTVNGKVDLKTLTDISEEIGDITQPKSETEAKIISIFEELLGRQTIGVKENFFYLGGQSITAALVISRIKEQFGVKLPLRDIFLNPTAEQLSFVLDTKIHKFKDLKINQSIQNKQEKLIVETGVEQVILQNIASLQNKYQDMIASSSNTRFIKLSPIQEISFQSGIKVSGMQMDFYEAVDVKKLELVWRRIVKEYDVLRSFIAINETKRGMEIYEMESELFLPYVELTTYDKKIKKKVLSEIESLRNQYYDNQKYAGDTLAYNIVFVKLKEEHYKLYFSCTHLIFDGYSGDLLEGRILELYHSSLDVLKAPEKMHSYEDYTKKMITASSTVSEADLLKNLKLDKFAECLQDYKNDTKEEELECFCYSYNWSDTEKRKEEEIVQFIENAYDKALRYAFSNRKVPFFVIINGREYKAFQFFEELGEFIDCMPFVFDSTKEENVFQSMAKQLETMKKYNINYVSLMVSENLQTNFPAVTNILMKMGVLGVNIPIFNYLILYQDISTDQNENIPHMNDNTAMNVSSISYTKSQVDMFILCPKKKIGKTKELLDKILGMESYFLGY